MILGRVVGTVVSTIKKDVYEGKKVLIVQPITPEGRPVGNSFLSVDSVQAGVGDVVLAAREGNTARQILGTDKDPFHSVILAIVDQVNVGSGT
jgi:microcompartment protein CcmK/EutM